MFHAWRSSNFNENAETIGVYVQRIRQVAAMLNCGELLILKVLKTLCLSYLYWVLFPTFLTVKEENEQRNQMVVFNESNVIGAKIDKLTSMIGKLSTWNSQ